MNDVIIPDGIFRSIVEADVIGKLQPEFDGIYYYDPITHKIKARGTSSAIETPWVHVKKDPGKRCLLYHFIFRKLNFVPKRCLNCWKVVVKPRTIKELWLLYHLQQKLGYACKCGIEEREYVRGLYGGYFYNNGYEAGRKCHIDVKQAVSNNISPDVPVILKRYCTEFEIQFGDSKDYQRPSNADWYEQWIADRFELDDTSKMTQPRDIQIHIFNKWIKFAWKYDMSDDVFEFGKPEDFYTTPRTY